MKILLSIFLFNISVYCQVKFDVKSLQNKGIKIRNVQYLDSTKINLHERDNIIDIFKISCRDEFSRIFKSENSFLKNYKSYFYDCILLYDNKKYKGQIQVFEVKNQSLYSEYFFYKTNNLFYRNCFCGDFKTEFAYMLIETNKINYVFIKLQNKDKKIIKKILE